MLQYTGTVKVKRETKQVSEKFKTREFVLTDNATSYPQTIQFQLTQDRCSMLDTVKVGDEITATFLLKGREWKNPQGEIKYFNSLDVIRIAKVKSNQQEELAESSTPTERFTPTPDDDLPF